ncbi:Centromere protein S [Desmophyllum pertusum]|uniref:Centromere protein S n=1 Tax=Desmophyllum pertusum TaxID=174260 RepID=A0A9X0DB61_9CNID|nr:Centromere protein S [Desmophyllum pertusum]
MAASGEELEDEEYEALAYQQLLKAALHYTVGRICEKEGGESGLQFSRRFIAALTETTFKQCESFATDLELFAKHAKRTQINCDDVQLLARKSSALAAHIDDMSKEIAKAHEADKANRKTKKAKKSKPAQESAAVVEIEDES